MHLTIPQGTVALNGIAPNANGEIVIDMRSKTGAILAYVGAIVVHASALLLAIRLLMPVPQMNSTAAKSRSWEKKLKAFKYQD